MCSRRIRGFSLIEMVVAIVIIGVGLAGVLTAFQTTVRDSADPLVRKQMLAIAEEMLEEILLQPYAAAAPATANALAVCGAAGAVRSAFNDVRDYNGYQTTGTCDITGAAVAGLEAYNVSVAVAVNAAPAADLVGLPAGAVMTITVVVSRVGAEAITLTGWRTNHAI